MTFSKPHPHIDWASSSSKYTARFRPFISWVVTNNQYMWNFQQQKSCSVHFKQKLYYLKWINWTYIWGISITILILMYIYPNYVKKQATRYVFSLDYVMFLTSQVRCYYIIVLLNAILTIVQLSGTSVVSITHIKLKISKKRHYDLSQWTSTLPINYYSMIVINIHCM